MSEYHWKRLPAMLLTTAALTLFYVGIGLLLGSFELIYGFTWILLFELSVLATDRLVYRPVLWQIVVLWINFIRKEL